jgi:hypothetical protein
MARPRKAQELDIGRRAVEETIRLVAQRGDFDVPLTEVAKPSAALHPRFTGTSATSARCSSPCGMKASTASTK